MDLIALLATYFSYVFVTVAYALKVRKYVAAPLGLRWELYPVAHEKGYKYGGSYLEETDWWAKPRHRNVIRSVLHLAARYLFMGSYLEKNPKYWVGLYPWHMGFILIILFDIMIGIEAILIKLFGLGIGANAGVFGQFLYYATIVVGLVSFAGGTIGSVLMLLLRTFDRDLKEYATPQNYFNYVFLLVLFLSGWTAWLFGDRTFGAFRNFWVGVITAQTVHVEFWEWAHIMVFSAFLVYLPMTRSVHYITKIFHYFWVTWGDAPNLAGGPMEAKIKENLAYRPGWSADHFKGGGTWAELATKLPWKEESERIERP